MDKTGIANILALLLVLPFAVVAIIDSEKIVAYATNFCDIFNRKSKSSQAKVIFAALWKSLVDIIKNLVSGRLESRLKPLFVQSVCAGGFAIYCKI